MSHKVFKTNVVVLDTRGVGIGGAAPPEKI